MEVAKELSIKEKRAQLIEHMLSAVEDEFNDRGRRNEFIESIRDQFDKEGWLSDGQIEGLRKFYNNAK